MTYKEIRKQQYDYHVNNPLSNDWDWDSPYTFIKSRYYMELASILVYILQYTNIHPNYITILYGILGIISGVLIATGKFYLVIIGLFIMFNKSILDLADGHYARLKKKTSILGGILDMYAGTVGTYSFYIGLSIYIARINPWVLVYCIPLYFLKSKGRACIIDLISVAVLASLFF